MVLWFQVCNRHPPFGNGIVEAVSSLPKYEMALDQDVSIDIWVVRDIFTRSSTWLDCVPYV